MHPHPPPTSKLTVLYVEDDFLSREMVLSKITPMFNRVDVAEDGAHGLKLFLENPPDLILTDQLLPIMSGLEMVQKIRALDQEIPVILMTSSMDNQVLLDSINIGVSRFIPKPVDFAVLTRELKKIASEVVNRRIVERHLRQEMAELRYKDSYHSQQQEAARRKEHYVIRNDLRHRAVTDGDGNRWGVEVTYSPRDIMCGDAYTVRLLPDGRILIFVVDAMGSGLSASISALLATSFGNYFVQHIFAGCACAINATNFVARLKEFICGILLEDEVISCGFFLVNLARQEMDGALFGLPPILVRRLDGSAAELKSGNPPFSSYTDKVSYTKVDLKEVSDFLIVTDGVTDAELIDGGSYREEILGDFQASPTLSTLRRRFQARTSPVEQDDLTLLHMHRIDVPGSWSLTLDPEPTLSGLSQAVIELIARLGDEMSLDEESRDELELNLTEATLNALEHGCMGIGKKEKQRLLLEGGYDEMMAGWVPPEGCAISVGASLWKGGGQPLVVLRVADCGYKIPLGAMDAVPPPTALNGRGLAMIKQSCDSVLVGDHGGSLIMLKTIEGGSTR